MDNQYDVTIVGAGPIGGYTATLLAKQNIKTSIIEQHKQVGKPVSCAGLVTPRVFDLFEIPKKDIVQNSIKGANIHSPSGEILTIGGEKINALSIDRFKIDTYLLNEAERNNVSLFLENKVLSAQKYEDYIEIQTSKNKQFKSKLLIGADGPYSKIRDVFGMPQPKEYLRGIGAEVNNANLNPDFVEIFIGTNIAPGFFAWIIPTNSNGSKARIGLCINQENTKPPMFYFNKFLSNQHTKKYFDNIIIEEKNGGIIPLGLLKQTVTDNVLLVGDAAAQVKPTSGGGIFPGLLCAQHCSKIVKSALENIMKNGEKILEENFF